MTHSDGPGNPVGVSWVGSVARHSHAGSQGPVLAPKQIVRLRPGQGKWVVLLGTRLYGCK